jgi:DNA-binding CsgD family transcriptional regulator/PAS domain-containing protein
LTEQADKKLHEGERVAVVPSETPHAARAVHAAVEAVVAARGRPERLARVFDRSAVPMVMVDNERRYVEVNPRARLNFRLSLAEFRALKVGDLTPPGLLPVLEPTWARLLRTGSAAGTWAVAGPDGGHFDIVFQMRAEVVPGLHLMAFAPAGWTAQELGLPADATLQPSVAPTPRELDVLQLAAQGLDGPEMAAALVVSHATVRSHFENVYAKLGVPGRVAAVATAMRLGLID